MSSLKSSFCTTTHLDADVEEDVDVVAGQVIVDETVAQVAHGGVPGDDEVGLGAAADADEANDVVVLQTHHHPRLAHEVVLLQDARVRLLQHLHSHRHVVVAAGAHDPVVALGSDRQVLQTNGITENHNI